MSGFWKRTRPALVRAVFRVGVLLLVVGGSVALFHPDTPLPDPWHPLTPLQVDAPLTGLTRWRLRAALADDTLCLRVLGGRAAFQDMPPHQDSDQCHIKPRVALRQVGTASLAPVQTRCQTALRLAMWERHGLQAAARRHMGQEVAELRHFSSYNCRAMRTSSGESNRMSSHAPADAIDISGVRLADGTVIDLKRDWNKGGAPAAFLRDAFDSACLWFPVALGPEFNALHADIFIFRPEVGGCADSTSCDRRTGGTPCAVSCHAGKGEKVFPLYAQNLPLSCPQRPWGAMSSIQ